MTSQHIALYYNIAWHRGNLHVITSECNALHDIARLYLQAKHYISMCSFVRCLRICYCMSLSLHHISCATLHVKLKFRFTFSHIQAVINSSGHTLAHLLIWLQNIASLHCSGYNHIQPICTTSITYEAHTPSLHPLQTAHACGFASFLPFFFPFFLPCLLPAGDAIRFLKRLHPHPIHTQSYHARQNNPRQCLEMHNM